MIYNRTQNDVDAAVDLRRKKVQSFQELTESEIAILEKGTMTITTLNRIETKQEELKSLLNDLGYWNTPTINKVWNYAQIFNTEEFQRIIDNTKILREAFYVYKSTPNTPRVSYHYEDINSLEKILQDLDDMINDIKSKYKRCGTFSCGELI